VVLKQILQNKMRTLINCFFKPFQKNGDGIFSLLLKREFSVDLDTAAFLASTPEDERTSTTRDFLDVLRQKYNQKTSLYKYASKPLRKKYDQIESEVKDVLYY